MSTLRGRIDRLEAAAGDGGEIVVIHPVSDWKGGREGAGYMAPFPTVPSPEDKGRMWLFVVGRMFADDPIKGLTEAQAEFLAGRPGVAVVICKDPEGPPESWEETTPADVLRRLQGVPRVTHYRINGQPWGYS